MWSDGLIQGPDGKMRQLVEQYFWSSGTFVNKSGVLRKRYVNLVTGQWTWDDHPMQMTMDETGRMGYLFPHFITMERAIALAWKLCAPFSANRVHVADGHPILAKHTSWSRPGSDDRKARRTDTWKPLRWWCGAVRVPEGYEVSSEGRLRKAGEITSGFYVDFNGDRRHFAGTPFGLIDLTTAAGLRDAVIRLPPRINLACDAIGSYHTPSDLAGVAGIELSTSWSYFSQAAPHMPAEELAERASRLVSHDLFDLLVKMRSLKHKLLGGRLVDLYSFVSQVLPAGGEFATSEFKMEQLRFGRISVLA